MNETAGKGVRLDSLAKGDAFRTRATYRTGVMVSPSWGGSSGVRVVFDDNGDEKTVHPGCIVDWLGEGR